MFKVDDYIEMKHEGHQILPVFNKEKMEKDVDSFKETLQNLGKLIGRYTVKVDGDEVKIKAKKKN